MKHESAAVFSPEGVFRYRLSRKWGPGGTVLFCMLNPSTANDVDDDATIRRCRQFAARDDFGGIDVVNLFAFRATDRRELKSSPLSKIGAANDQHISRALEERPAMIVAAWGAFPAEHPDWLLRARSVFATLKAHAGPRGVRCLGQTTGGFPCHPLYRPGDTKFRKMDVHP